MGVGWGEHVIHYINVGLIQLSPFNYRKPVRKSRRSRAPVRSSTFLRCSSVGAVGVRAGVVRVLPGEDGRPARAADRGRRERVRELNP